MVVGFVLIITEPTKEADVFNSLKERQEVTDIHPLFGEYDIIAKIDMEDFDKLGEFVVKVVREIKGVVETKTLTGIKF